MAMTTARSDKPFKRTEHRRERAAVRTGLGQGADATTLPHAKTFGDPWHGQKDGKTWLPPGRERVRGVRK